jgi:hypothetical protein
MRLRFRVSLAAGLVALALPAAAIDTNVPAQGLPTAPMYSATLLPERDGVVSWKTFADVEAVRQGSKIVPQFSKAVLALDKQKVRVQGFMMPLEATDQAHFLLMAVPPHCPFCMPAGPDAIVEVRAKAPVTWAMEPLIFSGTLAVLKDDPSGVLYRLTDAEPVATPKK